MKTEHHEIGRSLIRGALIDLRLIYLKVDQDNEMKSVRDHRT